MSVLTSGRNELSCYDNIGGIKNVYLFKYVQYSYSQIVGTKGVELTSFPATTIYKFEINGGSFTEKGVSDERGDLYTQELNFTLVKQDLTTTNIMKVINDMELRYIVEFNDGNYRIGGLYNGARVSSLEMPSGGSKGDFNGYRISLSSLESYGAAYINNLGDVGFTVDGEESIDNFIFQDGNNYLFQDSNNYMFN